MKGKYVKTRDREIIMKQLEHAEKCGVTWANGKRPTDWWIDGIENVGYSDEGNYLLQSFHRVYVNKAVSLEEWCDWLSEVTGHKEKEMEVPVIDENKGVMMEVRDYADEEWCTEKIIAVFSNGVAIDEDYIRWLEYRPIQQPKKRKMTIEEIRHWACSADALGWLVLVDDGIWRPAAFYSYLIGDEYRRAKSTPTGIDESTIDDFMVEE